MNHIDIPKSLQTILTNSRLKRLPKGQIILYEGDLSPDIFLIKEGVIKVHDIDNEGNEKILHVVKSPGLIPFVFFSGIDKGTQWFYTTVTDCDLYVIPRDLMNSQMKSDPSLNNYLMNWFSREVHEVLVRLSSLGKTNTRDKLAAVLKFLAVSHSNKKRKNWHRVDFPVNHQLLADMIGVTRESAALMMKNFQDKQLVRNPRLTVLEINFDKLISNYK